MPLKVTRRPGSPFWWITGTIAGSRIRESTGTGEKRLAEEKCAARETQLHREAIHGRPAERHTFAAVALSYLQHGGPHVPSTSAQIDRLIAYFGARTWADDVDQAALDRACMALLRPGPKPATRLRHIISPARAVLTHGARRKMCAMPLFDVGKASPARTDWLAPDQVDSLLAAAAPHLRPLIAFLAGTGARLGEALALDWRDVDLKHSRATLRDTKNGMDRIVDLCPRVMAGLLYDPRAEAAARRESKRGRVACQVVVRARVGRVFLTRAGRPYAERRVQGGGQIKTGWAAAVRRAKVSPTITPHGLRHTWASWHYAEHQNVLLLRSEGGWSTVTMVERYAHLVPAGLRGEIVTWRASGTILTQAVQADQKTGAVATA